MFRNSWCFLLHLHAAFHIINTMKDYKRSTAEDILGLNDPEPRNDVPYRGVMVYDHKTAGTIQVMNAETYGNWKSYQPGRYGRSAVKKAGGKNTAHI